MPAPESENVPVPIHELPWKARQQTILNTNCFAFGRAIPADRLVHVVLVQPAPDAADEPFNRQEP